MIWGILAAALLIAVAIVGIRRSIMSACVLLAELALGIAALWLLGAFFYVAAAAIAVAALALLVGAFIVIVRRSPA